TFFGEEDYLPALPRAHDAILPRRAGRDLGILLDAQSCSPDGCPAVRREPASRHRRGTSAVHAVDQLPGGLARAPVARPLRLVRHGAWGQSKNARTWDLEGAGPTRGR